MVKPSKPTNMSVSQVKCANHIEFKSPNALKPNPRNARTHPKQQKLQLAKAIKQFGFNSPVVIDSDNVILAGHGRVEAAKHLGLKKIPTIRIDHLNEGGKRGFALADNKIAANAGWDIPLLADEIAEVSEMLAEDGINIEIIGFSTAELDAIASDFDSAPRETPEDIPALPTTPVTLSGDVWPRRCIS